MPKPSWFPCPLERTCFEANCLGGLETISVWVGARITLMIDVNEQNILRYKLGLPWRDEEE